MTEKEYNDCVTLYADNVYRFHPQWQQAKELIDGGKIGELKTIHSFFSYYNIDPNNIRNQNDKGGGGLMDIGCYNISLSRFVFDDEPKKVLGVVEYDPDTKTDRLASGILQFAKGSSVFTCSTQLIPYQRVNIFGTDARIEIEIPFNAPPDKATRLWLHSKNGTEEMVFDVIDQYTLEADRFAKAILEEALKRLSETQRSLVVLKDYEGYSYEEIGKITNLSESQVKVYLHRARVQLKEYLVKVENVI